jgi:hypothetical protein
MAKSVDIEADVSCDPNYVPSAIELIESESRLGIDWED